MINSKSGSGYYYGEEDNQGFCLEIAVRVYVLLKI